MKRAELTRDLDAVTRHLVLLTALVESLATSVRSPQEGADLEDDAPVVPAATMPACTCPPCLAERARGERP